MKRVISLLLILSFIILPINAAGVINPSTESQPIWCRFYYTKWICDFGGDGEIGLTGLQGEQGIPGTVNLSATIAVGNTTTLDPGESATVENAGNETAIVLDFGIPEGEPGEAGEQGIQGEQGEQGIQGYNGTPGEQGIQGIQGEQGETGEIPDTSEFYLLNTSRALTGTKIKRDVNSSQIALYGGDGTAGSGAVFSVMGKDYAEHGSIFAYVSNAAGDGYSSLFHAHGATDTPSLSLDDNTIVDLMTGETGDSAVNKSYVDESSSAFDLCSNLTMIYPVYTVMINTDNVSPATSLGCGEWESLGTGYVLVGV